MQGMMIQEMSAVADQPRPGQGHKPKESPEQSFGKVLGKVEPQHDAAATKPPAEKPAAAGKAEASPPPKETAGSQPEASTPHKESLATNPVGEPAKPDSTATSPREKMAPFFMATLERENASLAESAPQTERIAAAERVQQLIARWLQGRQQTSADGAEETVENIPVDEVPPGLIVALRQLTAEQPAKSKDEELPELSAEEIQELQRLMAIMQQSPAAPVETPPETTTGQTEETVEPAQNIIEPPLADAHKEQLSQVSPLSQDTEPAATSTQENDKIHEAAPAQQPRGQQTPVQQAAQPEQLAAATEDVAPEAVSPAPQKETEQPTPRGGLQEERLARIAAPHRERQVEPRTESHPVKSPKEAATTETAQAKPHSVSETRPEVPPAAPVEEKAAAHKGEKELPAHDRLQGLTAAHVQAAKATQIDPQPVAANQRMMQLPSGQQLSEGQLVDQVVTYLAGSHDGESGRIRLQLHPAELGSLRLDLMVQGDKVRAHLHAQSQQVQQVLDRHLPLLRDALQQQGLKIDEFRVDLQHGHEQGQEQSWAWDRQQQQGQEHSTGTSSRSEDWQPEIEIPLPQVLQPATGGISLRV